MRDDLTVGEVAEVLGLTRQGVVYLDEELKPFRVGKQRLRLYSRRQVVLVAERRRAAR